MKYLKYIFRNALRNKLRSILTIFSIGSSLMLTTLLYGFMDSQDEVREKIRQYDRIVVLSQQGFMQPLPIAHVDDVRSINGVLAAVPFQWYGGLYEDERVPFAQFGSDAEYYFDVWSELQIEPDRLEAWKNDITGCVVGDTLAKERGWQVGDKIRLKGTIYRFDLDLTLQGIYQETENPGPLVFHLKYLDEGLRQMGDRMSGNAGIVYVKAESSDVIPTLTERIDANFENSTKPTRTESEDAFVQIFMDMIGNVQGYIQNISLAVIFSLVLVAANAMAMSVRERTSEVATLKAIGFTRNGILTLILTESVFISVLGGVFGVLAGVGVWWAGGVAFPGQWPNADIPPQTLSVGIALSAAIGLFAGIIPSWRAAHFSVIDGLRRVV